MSGLPAPFANRADAGRRLARRVVDLHPADPVVVGLPRGGVPVAAEVAAVPGRLAAAASQAISQLSDVAAHLGLVSTAVIYYFKNKEEILFACHEYSLDKLLALMADVEAESLSPEQKLRKLARDGKFSRITARERLEEALQSGLITQADFDAVTRARKLKRDVIMVDDFDMALEQHDAALLKRHIF